MLHLKTNEVVTPFQLADLFQVKTLKQSRFIKETNTLVLISDYTKGDRPNKWIGDTLHLTGNHKITGSTYSKLADSRTNGVTIHLFQVMNPKEYTYSGLVELAGDPYTENGPEGLVWVFPVRPNQASGVKKPGGLEFTDMEDFKNRGEQSILHFVRRRDNYIGYRVRHIEHGLGTVDSFDGTLITVTFDNHQTKSYNFNKSIQGGYLNFAA